MNARQNVDHFAQHKVTHPTGGLIFAMVVNFLMSTVVNILIDIHSGLRLTCL
ncbi:hypothetical protein BRIN106911_13495 [Brevibacillus invocatus]